MHKRQAKGWSRREFLGMTLAGTAGLLGLKPESLAAEPPPETTRIRLQRVPQLQWGGHRLYSPGYDDVVLRIGRHAGVSIFVRAKTPGKAVSQPVSLDLDFAEELGEPPQPYERLLSDALRGDPTLFPRWSVIEETWRIVQPLLDDPPPVERYEPRTWGPTSSHALAAAHGGWREPQ